MKQMRRLWFQLTVVPDNDGWRDIGGIMSWAKYWNKKEVPAGELKRMVSRLCKDGRFPLALKIYDWMEKEGIYKFSSRDHAVRINLIGKVRGCSAAEHYFRNLREQARNDKTFGDLLHCYVLKHRTEKALFHFNKMKESGSLLSPHPFNEIMCLYAKSLQIEKVLGVLAELKKSKVLPDNDSYRICISSFGLIYDVDGMERMLREMESQPQIVMDWCTYAVVAEFYDREFLLDKATDALKKARVILQNKGVRRKRPKYLLRTDYENVIKSLVKLGELEEAMKFVKQWEVLGNWRSVDNISIPYSVIVAYIKNGSLRKAFYRVIEWTNKRKAGVDKLSLLLCDEYLKLGDLFIAFDRFQVDGCMLFEPVEVQRLFLQYVEEECGSFFPLRCSRSLCTRSLKTDAGKTCLEIIPIKEKNKIKVALLIHPKNSTQSVNKDYENIITSLVESGELNEARKMAMEWEASGNLTSLDDLNISKLIIDGYCQESLFVEAEAMAEAWTREKRCWVRGIWLILACHYQEQGKMVRGLECMRRFLCLTPSLKVWKEDDEMFKMFLFMVEYSRGMNAAGYFMNRKYDLFALNESLCHRVYDQQNI
ncbi:unnamed protein product [Cuscuta campestris]|uniref:Pentacotripeptide-repeat region of PRORP domain-containing protein n=1 Tax=Cuscuta campestris TaxID=132261 RepID=A0A484LYW5_9ASTE|nr:unnamed protein product [Cuscuta campestris]